MAEDPPCCVDAGCDDHVSKPIDEAPWLNTCKRSIDEAAHRRTAGTRGR